MRYFLHNIGYYWWWIVKHVCNRLHVYCFVPTRFGIKNINMGNLAHYPHETTIQEISLDAADLYLGPDFLKDEYTLLDCPLTQSPHFSLIKTIEEGGSIEKTDYYKRNISGTLDWRHKQLAKEKTDFFVEKNKISKAKIINGSAKPVSVYRWKGRYYIYDGKHRASIYAYMNTPVPCVIVSPTCALDGVCAEMFNIVRNKVSFEAHKKFIE